MIWDNPPSSNICFSLIIFGRKLQQQPGVHWFISSCYVIGIAITQHGLCDHEYLPSMVCVSMSFYNCTASCVKICENCNNVNNMVQGVFYFCSSMGPFKTILYFYSSMDPFKTIPYFISMVKQAPVELYHTLSLQFNGPL